MRAAASCSHLTGATGSWRPPSSVTGNGASAMARDCACVSLRQVGAQAVRRHWHQCHTARCLQQTDPGVGHPIVLSTHTNVARFSGRTASAADACHLCMWRWTKGQARWSCVPDRALHSQRAVHRPGRWPPNQRTSAAGTPASASAVQYLVASPGRRQPPLQLRRKPYDPLRRVLPALPRPAPLQQPARRNTPRCGKLHTECTM